MDRTPPPSAGGPIPPLFTPCTRCTQPGTCRHVGRCIERDARPLPAPSGAGWYDVRIFVEDVVLAVLALVGGLTVLRWVLEISGAGAWLGLW
jgi:hypothetical protein